MMETEDYWIYENKIIFKPNFNDKIDIYQGIISKYNELIFSNYDDYNITIKTNNRYYVEYAQNNKSSKFNQKVIIPENVTHLTFGYNFDQQVTIPQSVTHLTFDYHFNQQVIIPHNVTHLTLGHKFNQQVNLPNIKYIKLNCNNIDIIENLPNSVEEIELDMLFNLKLQNLPNSIKKINFHHNIIYDKELNCLPEFVEYLELRKYYNEKISKFPLNLKTIKCHKEYKYIDDFKDKFNIVFL